MGTLAVVVEGSHEGPPSDAVRKKHAVTDAEVAFARIHRDGLVPGLAAVAADSNMCFLGGRVFAAFVEAVRRIQLALVSGEPDAVRRPATVVVRPFLFEHMKPRTLDQWQFGSFGKFLRIIPERQSSGEFRHIVPRRNRAISRSDLLCVPCSWLVREIVHCAVKRLTHGFAIPVAAECDGSRRASDRRLRLHLARGLSIQEESSFIRLDHQSCQVPLSGHKSLVTRNRTPASLA